MSTRPVPFPETVVQASGRDQRTIGKTAKGIRVSFTVQSDDDIALNLLADYRTRIRATREFALGERGARTFQLRQCLARPPGLPVEAAFTDEKMLLAIPDE